MLGCVVVAIPSDHLILDETGLVRRAVSVELDADRAWDSSCFLLLFELVHLLIVDEVVGLNDFAWNKALVSILGAEQWLLLLIGRTTVQLKPDFMSLFVMRDRSVPHLHGFEELLQIEVLDRQ